jgi:hypothetical protein
MVNLAYKPEFTLSRGVKTTIAAAIAQGLLSFAPNILPSPWGTILSIIFTGLVSAYGNLSRHKYGIKVPF